MLTDIMTSCGHAIATEHIALNEHCIVQLQTACSIYTNMDLKYYRNRVSQSSFKWFNACMKCPQLQFKHCLVHNVQVQQIKQHLFQLITIQLHLTIL